MRKPSAETEVRSLRRELAEVKALSAQRGIEANTFRSRATRAEQEVAEWKRRFDALLARTPELPAEASK